MRTSHMRAELLVYFAKLDARERSGTRQPLREELQYSPDGYLPEIDAHYPELGLSGRSTAASPCDPPPIDHDATANRTPPRVFEIGEDGLTSGGPLGFWIFMGLGCVAWVLLVCCELGWIGP